jgi:uncharacterized repeat protein (TIGR01451 family)
MERVGARVNSVERLVEFKKAPILGIIIITLITGVGVSGLLSASKTLSSSGSIKAINVEVFEDLDCTLLLSSLDWGTPEPGDVVTQIIYVKNTGNADMTLHLATSNWSPAGASNYLTLSWDQEGTTLSADEVATATMTLTVSGSITGIDTFTFQTIIEGTG